LTSTQFIWTFLGLSENERIVKGTTYEAPAVKGNGWEY